ncbi:hypothetical protein [Aureimonas ureilytica]|uniref:hypothetical protein n=1 Tax=Aureimonas ureilytica TaxID=401562 RepID=UPI000368C1C5|nr:hypothetical protein [Aureimonas ureilytica]
MTRLTNTSDTHQVIPTKGGSKDLAIGETDDFDVSADNPHVQAKLRAGLIALAEDDAAEAIPAEPEKPAEPPETSPRNRTPTKPATGDQPGGATSTL